MNIKSLFKRYAPSFLVLSIRWVWHHTVSRLSEFFKHVRLKKFQAARLVTVTLDENHTISIQITPNNGWVDNTIFLKGIHEKELLGVMQKEVAPGSTVLDIGCNIGQHSLFLSRFVGTNGRVIAFDPLVNNIQSLQQSIRVNKIFNLKAEQKAVGEGSGTVSISVPLTNNDRASRDLVFSSEINPEMVHVDMVSIDEYCQDIDVDFIKIDTEGFEPEVLEGALKVIKRCHPKILCEYSPMFYDSRNASGVEMLKCLREEGYSISDLDSGYGLVDDIVDFDQYVRQQGGGISNVLLK